VIASTPSPRVFRIELVRCTAHRESCCWVQIDGSHISTKACRCYSGLPPYLCPIDGHAIRFLLANPEWTEETQRV
jgi:hypothetical protein